jgi:hypothetical protein
MSQKNTNLHGHRFEHLKSYEFCKLAAVMFSSVSDYITPFAQIIYLNLRECHFIRL